MTIRLMGSTVTGPVLEIVVQKLCQEKLQTLVVLKGCAGEKELYTPEGGSQEPISYD